MLEALTVTGGLSGKSARPHQDAQVFYETVSQHFKTASTHGENLSQSDKTDVANALFNMDTKSVLSSFRS